MPGPTDVAATPLSTTTIDPHAGHSMGNGCSTKMTFNSDVTGMCVVFEWWNVTTPGYLALSFFGIVAIVAMYESLRKLSRAYDRRVLVAATESTSLEAGHILTNSSITSIPLQQKVARSLLYGAQVLISMWIMLIFMTYNLYMIMAVVFGAILGHLLFGQDASAKDTTICH